ncbi:ABC transporter ATP-binding protein [Cytobacillus sp. Sa5YUA1]|uniref:ABC transporter ATP-binding protein n=1 Tax=Cytobacillus stercorigallinarum TaxID=2762240 RepID=A0ABR8QSF4_9BACI|nr:ABC transporter ATP-binding protein [Cytobacillus stercorigallinarum]MBD7938428.1 ABC transporter ATP-binding protein [Cytobacillus stercorigallinarum]
MSNQPKEQKTLDFGRGPSRMNGKGATPKKFIGTLLRIWQYMKQQKIRMILVVFMVLLSTLFTLAGPYLIGVIIDDFILKGEITGTIVMSALLACIYILISITTWAQTLIMVNVSLLTIKKIRQELFDQLQSLSLKFFDKRSYGELMSRVTNDIDNLHAALSQSVIQIVSSVLTITGVAIAMIALNGVMAIVAFLVIPLMFLATKAIVSYSSHYFSARQRDLGEVNGQVEESISGLEIIALYGKEDDVLTSFEHKNEMLRTSSIRAEISSGFLGPVNNFINNLGLAFIIFTGALLAIVNMASIGMIASFVTYSRNFYRPINQLSNLITTFQSAIAGAERVFEILDEKTDIVESPSALKVSALVGNVEFRNVSFAYEQREVLSSLSFSVKAGETIAIVGPTGSGKTTIIQLLARFYDVTKGAIYIDGEDIRDYEIRLLRKNIGIVLQDSYLFSGTVMENIRYGKLKAKDTDVIEAAKLASAHAFIKHLPKGYDTFIESGGSNLSQGQKQLLSIARAMLANPNILILDEATSSIDTQTEIQIQKGLAQLTKGKTTFVIAHRLKTIEQANHIMVIKDGEIVEQGSHQRLYNKQGVYADMYKQQFLN